MTTNGSDTQTPRHTDRAIAGIAVASGLLAGLLRIPAFLAGRHLSFDDGVYGASAIAMRHGGVPFREVFSSQGPLFLPLVFLGDLLGLRSLNSPRVLAVLAGACTAGFTAAIAARLADTKTRARIAAVVAGVLAATSGALWWTTGPTTSDGPTIALCVAAIWTAYRYRDRPTSGRAVAIGILLGCAVAVKLVMAGPAIAICGLLMLTSSRRRDLIVAALPLVAIPCVAAVAFGLSDVWEQVVTYHTRSTVGSRNPLVHLRKLTSTLLDRDLPLTIMTIIAAVGVSVGAWRTRKADGSERSFLVRATSGLTPIGLWLVLTVGILAIQQPLWRNHVAYVIAPMAILVGTAFARSGPTTLALLTAGILVLPYHLTHTRDLWEPEPYQGIEDVMATRLRALPTGAQAISDDPGLVWRSGLRTPDNFVDTSVLRITSPVPSIAITTTSVIAAAVQPEACAVVITSPQRFGALPGLTETLAAIGYFQAVSDAEGRSLWIKSACPGADPTDR